nr:54S ribosomal protein L24, mitochondrial [Ipomoea batatas]
MAFRSKETMKKLVKNLGGEKNLASRAKERLEKLPLKSTVVMGRAHRGLYAGRHIQFGNQVSEDGGNNCRNKIFIFSGIQAVLQDTRITTPSGLPPSGPAHRPLLKRISLASVGSGLGVRHIPHGVLLLLGFRGRHRTYRLLCSPSPSYSAVFPFGRTRRNWKPNVQGKRLFSYILDRFIRVKVTTHALRCIDKAGGLDEYLLKTPYHKMDAEFGLFWKAKVEKLYEELGEKKVFASLEDESKVKEKFKELKLVEKAHCKEARIKMYDWILKSEKIEEGGDTPEATNNEASTTTGEASASDTDFHKQMVANA